MAERPRQRRRARGGPAATAAGGCWRYADGTCPRAAVAPAPRRGAARHGVAAPRAHRCARRPWPPWPPPSTRQAPGTRHGRRERHGRYGWHVWHRRPGRHGRHGRAWQKRGLRVACPALRPPLLPSPPPPLTWVWRTSSALSSGSSEASRPAPCSPPCPAAAPCTVGKRCSSANLTPGRSSRRVTPCSEAKARAWASVAVLSAPPSPPPALAAPPSVPTLAERLELVAAPGGEADAIPRGGCGGGEGGDRPSSAGSRDRAAANDASSSPASGSTGHDELRVASSSAPPKPLPPARAAASAAAGTPSSPRSAMRSVATNRWRMPRWRDSWYACHMREERATWKGSRHSVEARHSLTYSSSPSAVALKSNVAPIGHAERPPT